MIPGPAWLALFFAVVAAATAGALGTKSRALALGLPVWLALTGAIGWSGLAANFGRVPPPLPVLVLLSAGLATACALGPVGKRLVAGAGIAWLVGFQAFRVAVEIFLDLGYRAGMVPVQMTFEGRNWDALSGLSAALLAGLLARKKVPDRAVLAWNVLALLLLANIAAIAILSMPTALRRFQNEPANTFVAHFPYIWLPTFLVQAAWFGHLLVFRWLAQRKRGAL